MSRTPRWKAVLVVVAALLVAAGLAACGGGGSSSSSSTSESSEAPAEETGGETKGAADEGEGGGGSNEEIAAESLKVAEEHIKSAQIGPTEPIKNPIPKGKKLIYVNCGQPACTTQGEYFAEAAQVLGWTVEEIAAEPTPQSIQASFEEVVRKKPDGVASAGFGPALYPKQVKALNEMNIPIFESTGEVESGEAGITYDPSGLKKRQNSPASSPTRRSATSAPKERSDPSFSPVIRSSRRTPKAGPGRSKKNAPTVR